MSSPAPAKRAKTATAAAPVPRARPSTGGAAAKGGKSAPAAKSTAAAAAGGAAGAARSGSKRSKGEVLNALREFVEENGGELTVQNIDVGLIAKCLQFEPHTSYLYVMDRDGKRTVLPAAVIISLFETDKPTLTVKIPGSEGKPAIEVDVDVKKYRKEVADRLIKRLKEANTFEKQARSELLESSATIARGRTQAVHGPLTAGPAWYAFKQAQEAVATANERAELPEEDERNVTVQFSKEASLAFRHAVNSICLDVVAHSIYSRMKGVDVNKVNQQITVRPEDFLNALRSRASAVIEAYPELKTVEKRRRGTSIEYVAHDDIFRSHSVGGVADDDGGETLLVVNNPNEDRAARHRRNKSGGDAMDVAK